MPGPAIMEGFDLSGRIAVVTGGGTGIGRAIALLLAERGADIVLAGRKPEPLESTAREIEALGRQTLALGTDVRKVDAIQAMVARTVERFGKLDILINNAGGTHGHIGLAKIDPVNWERDLSLNLSAAQHCSQAAFPHLKASRGCIVNISSLAGVHGTQGVGAYSAAKAGLQMLTRVAAAEWGPLGIRVNCVAPGMTGTELAQANWARTGFDADRAAKVFPLQRWGLPREVAQMVVFFASDAASYITGETVAVGGGPTIGGMVKISD